MSLKLSINEQIASAKFLIEQGAHLLRCGTKVSEKAPISKAWQTKPDTLAAITKHIKQGKPVGVIFASLNLIAVDIDAKTPEKASELRQKAKSLLGTDGFICDSPSLSHYTEGSNRVHAIYAVDQHPLGIDSDGAIIGRRGGLYLDGDREMGYELRYDGCQTVIPDLTILADAIRDKPATTCSRIPNLVQQGESKTNSSTPPTAQAVLPPGLPDPERINHIVNKYLDKVGPIIDGDADNGHNATAHKTLFWAGQVIELGTRRIPIRPQPTQRTRLQERRHRALPQAPLLPTRPSRQQTNRRLHPTSYPRLGLQADHE